MAIAIQVEQLSKRFLLGQTFENTLSSRVADLMRGRVLRKPAQEEFWALRDVSFEIAQGEAVGIIGGNGAGKSTLLKILSRITPPTSGRARVKGRLSSLLEVGTGFHPELTGRENVFLNGAILGMRNAEVARKFDEIVAFAGVEKFIDTPVKRYSSGMYVRLAFAVAAHLEPDVLIIDEVLAVGDADFQTRCLGKMGEVAQEGRTVLFVSHNMAAVQKLCSRAVLMMSGRVADVGSVDTCVSAYLGSASSGEAVRSFEREDERFWLKGVALKTLEDVSTTDFGFDQPVKIQIDYEQPGAIPGLVLGIRIRTAGGGAIFSSERPLDEMGPLLTGGGRASVVVPGKILVPGRFLVTVGVHIPGVEILSLKENVISYLVHETGSSMSRYANRDVGCVIVDCAWRDEALHGTSS